MSDHEARARKLAERIQVIVAETIERRIKDPRMGFVTITDVRVTGDLREATVLHRPGFGRCSHSRCRRD